MIYSLVHTSAPGDVDITTRSASGGWHERVAILQLDYIYVY